jgi:hypothetical protein
MQNMGFAAKQLMGKSLLNEIVTTSCIIKFLSFFIRYNQNTVKITSMERIRVIQDEGDVYWNRFA